MNASEQMRVGQILVATLAALPADYWTSDNRSFAAAAKKLAADGENEFAARFWISEGAVGYQSHEFREVLSLMHTATLISYNSQHDDRFYIEIGPRGAEFILKRTNAAPAEIKEAKELMLEQWRTYYNQEWVKDTSA